MSEEVAAVNVFSTGERESKARNTIMEDFRVLASDEIGSEQGQLTA